MMYCFREREQLLNINELLAGFRLFPSYMRVGGLRELGEGAEHHPANEPGAEPEEDEEGTGAVGQDEGERGLPIDVGEHHRAHPHEQECGGGQESEVDQDDRTQ